MMNYYDWISTGCLVVYRILAILLIKEICENVQEARRSLFAIEISLGKNASLYLEQTLQAIQKSTNRFG